MSFASGGLTSLGGAWEMCRSPPGEAPCASHTLLPGLPGLGYSAPPPRAWWALHRVVVFCLSCSHFSQASLFRWLPVDQGLNLSPAPS